jgi:uncharacterized small protein (DUF1192 family)
MRLTMERLEINVETGESKIIALTNDEISEAEARAAEWKSQQSSLTVISIEDLQNKIEYLTSQITALQDKIGA